MTLCLLEGRGSVGEREIDERESMFNITKALVDVYVPTGEDPFLCTLSLRCSHCSGQVSSKSQP